jgi:selenide,water dikinase
MSELASLLCDVDGYLERYQHSDRARTDGTARDDSALVKISPGLWLVATVDFGTPVSNDPKVWGAISAAHALSDVYAMGGTPIFALSILGWPAKLDRVVASQVAEGAIQSLAADDVLLVGGHSIRSNVPIFGLAVTGTVGAGQAFLVGQAKPGDALVLTKPLGTGIITAARKACIATEADVKAAEDVMQISNRLASTLARDVGVRAATDVSGNGLIGHLRVMLEASQCSAVLDHNKIPILDSAVRLIEDHGIVPNSAEQNYFSLEDRVIWGTSGMAERLLLCDPQTSGGLLMSVDKNALDALLSACIEAKQAAVTIGYITEDKSGRGGVVELIK